jgi:putative modified peptide
MNKPLTAPLDPALADRLLDLLSTDDLFRERFQRDHFAALRTIGYEPPLPAQMTACGEPSPVAALEPFRDCRVQDLASKDAIRSAREEIKAMLTRGLAQNAPKLDARNATATFNLK